MHGRKIEGLFCDKCGAHTDGRMLRERFRWQAIGACGHRMDRGYVLPPEELERRGYVNKEQARDPRAIMTEESKRKEQLAKWREETHWHISKSNYCLIDGKVQTNPLYGISMKELDRINSQAVLELLEAINDLKKIQNFKEGITLER